MPHWYPDFTRRQFLGSAAAAGGVYGLSTASSEAAIPYAYDGSTFQLAAPEPNPKSGGVMRYGVLHVPAHQVFTLLLIASHPHDTQLSQVGQPASEALEQVAEGGDTSAPSHPAHDDGGCSRRRRPYGAVAPWSLRDRANCHR
jgi:hypothetical protein